MNKPMIGIIPLIDIERESYWMLPGYMKGIEEAGGTSVMLPLTSDKETLRKFVNYFDGFLFTGGHDVSPSLYRKRFPINAENAAPSGTKWKPFCCLWCWNKTSLYLGSAGACS